jgi:hypothetical protein
MAKASGIGWSTFSVDDATNTQQAIVDDITDVKISTPRAVQDVTGMDKSAIQRLLLLADCTMTINGVFDGASNMAHAVFSTIPSTSVNRLITILVNSKNFAPTMVLTDYPLTRATGGALTFSVPASLANGAVPTWS